MIWTAASCCLLAFPGSQLIALLFSATSFIALWFRKSSRESGVVIFLFLWVVFPRQHLDTRLVLCVHPSTRWSCCFFIAFFLYALLRPNH
ncbi:uncharacterized protein An15g06590 [Aspergillus niger]|uniref:Contig An15c0220, genomic contig n=2 Tax=Aspergillus niger TaxID=5061 RepID=A2R644_ASPNC|nr:uncharacterized protein An15g06590 [Aspergillus niger]CAK42611.1 unnamed protein product [Aspergillus niger]